jgi:hypothetical protein
MIWLVLVVAAAALAAAPSPPAAAAATDAVVLAQAQEPAAEAPASQEGQATEAPPEAEEAEEPEPQEAVPEAETAPADDAEAAGEPEAEQPAASEEAEAAPEPSEPAEEGGILRSPAALPEPVRATWQALIDATQSGHIERLQPIIEEQEQPPMVAFDDVGDPIAHLRTLSGDAEGREILAILLEVLQAGFLHVDAGTPQEMYLWPYFARYPADELTPKQMVELFTLLTAGDYQDMLSYGTYIFFRVGIAPDGRWLFFLAGD